MLVPLRDGDDDVGAERRGLREGHLEFVVGHLRRRPRDGEGIVVVTVQNGNSHTKQSQQDQPQCYNGFGPPETPHPEIVEQGGHHHPSVGITRTPLDTLMYPR